MKNLVNTTKYATVAAVALFGFSVSAFAADVTCSEPAMVKNLRAYNSHCVSSPDTPHQLTQREVKHLIATAKTPADHLTIAHYYEAQAAWLDNKAGSYEEAAADARHSPAVKNVGSPTTAARLDYLAKGYREEATSDRAIAAAQEQLAKTASVVESPKTSASVVR
jgi:hypothetical protein